MNGKTNLCAKFADRRAKGALPYDLLKDYLYKHFVKWLTTKI